MCTCTHIETVYLYVQQFVVDIIASSTPLPKLSIFSLYQNSKRMLNEQGTNEKVGLGGKDSGLEELREAQAQIGFYGKTGIGTNPGRQTSLLFLYPDC